MKSTTTKTAVAPGVPGHTVPTRFWTFAIACSASLCLHTGEAARISEPSTQFYGRIAERVGNREFPITTGQLTWKLRTTGPGGREFEVTTRLAPLSNGQYSYRLAIPHEVLAYDLAVSPKAVVLSNLGGRVEHVSITLDGKPLTVAPNAVAGFTLDSTRRAGIQRIDLSYIGTGTDTDGDGAPDWWEDQNGLDKWDPSDGNPSTEPPATGGGSSGSSQGTTSGTGVARTFSEWRAAWFPGQQGDLATFEQEDSDRDGFPNLLEYAFGLDPTQSDSPAAAALPHSVRIDGRPGISFVKRPDVTDLEYRIETSTNLLDWSGDTGGTTVMNTANGVTTATLENTGPEDDSGLEQRFWRVRVSRR